MAILRVADTLNEFNENTGTVISRVLYTHKFLCVETVEINISYG